MGVVHKLKKEVFDFIVNKKQEDPLISCRKLSELTSETFQIKVSKSSVNSVLKESQLSSSVGRRVQKKAKSKAFQIPPQKKKQLLESISSLGFTINEQTSPEGTNLYKKTDIDIVVSNANNENAEAFDGREDESGFSLEKLARDLQEHDRRKRIVKSFSKEERSIQEQGFTSLTVHEDKEVIIPAGPKFFDEEEFLYNVKIVRENKVNLNKSSNLYDNAGVVFLKAAQVDMSSEDLLGDILGKNSQGMNLDNFSNICSSLVFLKAFGVQSVETIEASRNDALWRLNGFKGYPGRDKLFGWTQKINFSNQLQFEYLNEKEQAINGVSAFKVIFEDLTSVTFDSQLRSFWKGSIQKSLFSSVSRAMTTLSRKMISNNDCLVMDVLNEKSINRNDLERLFMAFYDIPGKKISKIEVLNEKQEVISDFTLIPSIKRSILIGFRPYQEIFQDLSKQFMESLAFSYYDSRTDSILYYSEKNVSFFRIFNKVYNFPERMDEAQLLKLVFLGKEKGKMPQIVLLTNKFKEKAETIIESYLNCWPSALKQQFISEETGSKLNSPMIDEDQQEYYSGHFLEKCFSNLGDIFQDYLLTLNTYCLEKYFPKQKGAVDIKTMVPIFYGLQGLVQEKNDQITTIIMIPEKYKFLDVLDFAINSVNDRNLTTKEGKRLFVSAEDIKT